MDKLNELQEIGEFLVTDKSYSRSIEILGLTEQDIKNIPENAVVLNIGSGILRQFERGLQSKRPDLKILSIDPTLGIMTYDKEGNITTQGFRIDTSSDNNDYHYVFDDGSHWRVFENSFYNENAINLDKQRKKSLKALPGALAALASHLPLKNESVEVVFDCLGPIYYLQNPYDKQEYLSELKRILSPNGVIYISDLDEMSKIAIENLNLKCVETNEKLNYPYKITKILETRNKPSDTVE